MAATNHDTVGSPYRVPPEPKRWPSIGLAVGVHALLLAFLYIGVSWQTNSPVTVEAEVWDMKVQSAAPPPPPPAPEPEPEPEPETPPPEPTPRAVEPPPPPPVAKPEPVAKPAPKTPDIALEQKKRKEELKRKQAAEEERERELAEERAEQKRADEKKAKALADKQQRERDEKERKLTEQKEREAAEKKEQLAKLEQAKKDEAKKKADKEKADKLAKAKADKAEKAEAEQLAKLAKMSRDAETKRITGSGNPGSTGSAEKSTAPRSDAGYQAAISAKIKSNANYAGSTDVPGNPTVSFRVEQLPTGEIVSVKMTKSSGIPEFDDAVERSINKSSPLPKKKDGTVERSLSVNFHMKDLN
jgi:colicin import membrane protein